MLHLTKLAVGVRDLPQLRAAQQARGAADPPLRHRTRTMPRRASEVTAGGSIFWVVAGALLVRQRVLRIEPDCRDDGTACAAFHLDPVLVPVLARPVKPFQGWRYLDSAAAPPDLSAVAPAHGEAELPPALRQALRELCLL